MVGKGVFLRVRPLLCHAGRVSRMRGCGSVAQHVLYQNETTHQVMALDVTPIWMWVCNTQFCNSQNSAPPAAERSATVNGVVIVGAAVVAQLLARRRR